jgi:hypothetical protein
MQQEIQLPGNYSTLNPLVVWRVLHVENDVMKPAGYYDNKILTSITDVPNPVRVEITDDLTVGDASLNKSSSPINGNGRFENGLLRVNVSPVVYGTIEANGDQYVILTTPLNLCFSATKEGVFNNIWISGYTGEIFDEAGKKRVNVDSVINCLPSPPDWGAFAGGKMRIGTTEYTIISAEQDSFLIDSFSLDCTLHDDDVDTRVSTRLDLTAAATAFADAYILVVDDGGGTPSNSGVGVNFMANRDSVGLQNDVIAQGVSQSAGSEPPNYWIGYASTAHQGSDTTRDADPATENDVVLGQAFGNTSTNKVGRGGKTAWVYVESTHDADGATGPGMVQRTAAHEMGHECGLDDSVGGKLMESGGTDLLFIGRDVNLLRCRIKSPGPNP